MIDDLVEGHGAEVPGHELDDGSEPHHGRAHADAREALLGDGRVDHPAGAEALEEPFGHLVRALVVPDLLAHQEHAIVAVHLLGDGLSEGLAVPKFTHR